MIAEALSIPAVRLLRPRIHRDARGHFLETWRLQTYCDLGIGPFVQDNVSYSRRNVLRGLHFQHPGGQGKLVSALRGVVLDVAADLRVGSPTFGRWVRQELSDENGCQLFIPVGFAHGFLVLSEEAVVCYKCTSYYAPEHESTIRWNDPTLAVKWPIKEPTVASRDANARLLDEFTFDALPKY